MLLLRNARYECQTKGGVEQIQQNERGMPKTLVADFLTRVL